MLTQDDKSAIAFVYVGAAQYGSGTPQIRNVKLKASGKLTVWGDGFDGGAIVLVDG